MVIAIMGLLIVGFQTVSYGQAPALEPGESQAYGQIEIWDEIKAIGGAIVDGIKSFFGWLFGVD